MGTLFKILVVAVIVLGLTAAAGLAIMAVVAGTHDVIRIPVPKECSLYTNAGMWDYADAYRRPMEFNSYRNVDQMIANISIKGDAEIHRSETEVVYVGHLPGIEYQVSYMLDRNDFPPAVELATIYRFKTRTGRYLWKLFRPIHRCLAPYMLDRLGSLASG